MDAATTEGVLVVSDRRASAIVVTLLESGVTWTRRPRAGK
jgi:hypothetical protein